jgi:hypothetical protein
LLNKHPNKKFGAVTGIDAIHLPNSRPEITRAGERDMTNEEDEHQPQTIPVDAVVHVRLFSTRLLTFKTLR